MNPTRRSGRVVGILLFLQLAGLMVPFILLMPAVTANFLTDAAARASLVRTAVLLLFANGALTIWISIRTSDALRARHYAWAVWLVATSVSWFVLQSVDNALLMTMLSLSEGRAADTELLNAIGTAVRGIRRWTHYTELLAIDIWFFAFYGALFRSSLIPRVLSGFGLAMVFVHAAAIPLATFIGYRTMPSLGVSLAVSHLAVATWLVVKGFAEREIGVPNHLG
ncbi:MAG: DUF4386 family protein [Thermoanaerobaculia bacterium]